MIETKRLMLRNYKMSDLEDYWEYVSQPHVGTRCGWEPYTDKEKAKERLGHEIQKPFQFAIELKEENKVIGSVEIMTIDGKDGYSGVDLSPDKTRELGALLSEKYWNKGIMTEACFAVVKYCFDVLKVENVVAGFFSKNVASGKMQQKCGLKPYEVIKNSKVWYLTNELCDSVHCKITKEEYLANNDYKNLDVKFLYD